MKKFYSLVMASAIAFSNLATLSSNATTVDSNGGLSVTSKTVRDEIVLFDGRKIPVGAVALTVSMRNNNGFTASSTKLDIEGSEILEDEDGKPIVIKGELLNNSIIAAVEEDNILVVSSASVENATNDGEMFTVFLSSEPSNIAVTDITNDSISVDGSYSRSSLYTYYIGDVTHNTYINAVDASNVLQAIDIYADGNSTQYTRLPVSVANANISTYFPYVHYAEAADTNKNNYIGYEDANNILDFYSYVQLGHTPEEAYDYYSVNFNFCGELVMLIES